MKLPTLLTTLLPLPLLTTAFPNAPFNASQENVVDATGSTFRYAGLNWPGHGGVMIPEGLQYQSISNIVGKIKSLGMNVVRLTFAIEMVDDIVDGGGDVRVKDAFVKALGSANGTKVWGQVRAKNPGLSENVTRTQVFDAVAAELGKQGIYVHLDNHMSKGAWCCSATDGNTWFGDTYFDVAKWKRGVTWMATHGKAWPNFVSIGLRNEFRKPTNASATLPYNYETLYTHISQLARFVNAANPDILVFLSGLDYDTKLTPFPNADDLGNGTRFRLSDFAFANKLVLELHNYQNNEANCGNIEGGLWNAGFKATGEGVVNRMPVVLTEFGFTQVGEEYKKTYATCIAKLMPQWKTGWTVWVLAGSYYTRSGTQDFEETWGLVNHDWSDWRNPAAIAQLKGMVEATLNA